MKSWSRTFGYVLVMAVIAGAYFIGRAGRGDTEADATTPLPDPGYAALDAEVIETGYDGRERYRLNAKVIRQQGESGVIDLEALDMDYHPGAQGTVPGEKLPPDKAAGEVWHLKSDRGQVRADGDDVQLTGNVVVTGHAPGSGAPLVLSTDNMRINTPTEYLETSAPVKLSWAGHDLDAVGMQADLKAGTLRLESEVHGSFSNK
ncbi:MAG: LPS export ABC transporter periplasmic protein LptC [Pseudomonadota bacterium]